MTCPHCGLFNPPEAVRCDCGWDFVLLAMMRPYLEPGAPYRRSPIDLVSALAAHFVTAPLYLLLTVGLAQSVPVTGPASTGRTVAGLFATSLPPVTWAVLAVMLIVWWRQGRGPVWSYP